MLSGWPVAVSFAGFEKSPQAFFACGPPLVRGDAGVGSQEFPRVIAQHFLNGITGRFGIRQGTQTGPSGPSAHIGARPRIFILVQMEVRTGVRIFHPPFGGPSQRIEHPVHITFDPRHFRIFVPGTAQ